MLGTAPVSNAEPRPEKLTCNLGMPRLNLSSGGMKAGVDRNLGKGERTCAGRQCPRTQEQDPADLESLESRQPEK